SSSAPALSPSPSVSAGSISDCIIRPTFSRAGASVRRGRSSAGAAAGSFSDADQGRHDSPFNAPTAALQHISYRCTLAEARIGRPSHHGDGDAVFSDGDEVVVVAL